MPKRQDIQRILILGSGPIVIGQACEFDYSGVQACKILRSLGYTVILLNSNPATIMTDPDIADITYIEALQIEIVENVIKKEKPQALLATVGGQTALNLAMELHNHGILAKYNIELLGATPEVITLAEDRSAFKECMISIGVPVATSATVYTLEQALEEEEHIGLPAIIRPGFTLGGQGGGIAHTHEEFVQIVTDGLTLSPIHQVLIEKSLLGWKEFELEVMRDNKDNAIIVCSIENLDPMGVHTGDSITVAPIQTLTDKEYQRLRSTAIQIMRAVGVETGGANVQFALHPHNAEFVVIEMNPRVSRSSALASKATGFPIAKIAAQLAVGLTLDEIENDITKQSVACFEPSLDYVVVKIPRWNFAKFPNTPNILDTQMRSLGEVMSIGGSFTEAFHKALQSIDYTPPSLGYVSSTELHTLIQTPNAMRIWAILEAFSRGYSPQTIAEHSHIDRWFLWQIHKSVQILQQSKLPLCPQHIAHLKRLGWSDTAIATQLHLLPEDVRQFRFQHGLIPQYKIVDTCAGEFASNTPYLYSTYGYNIPTNPQFSEIPVSSVPAVLVIGSGPNRIGQGIEFDYCCCQATIAIRKMGYTSIMLNCNPETVSTDYDTADILYFEPITKEHVQQIIEKHKPLGTILQFGGQTPLHLAHDIPSVLGSSASIIDLCEDREKCRKVISELGFTQPKGEIAYSIDMAKKHIEHMGLPVILRPSYVLGGESMKICHTSTDVHDALQHITTQHLPLLIDEFIVHAVEYDVDIISDGTDICIAGIMEQIEEAGIHSGDSSAVYPPQSLSPQQRNEIETIAHHISRRLGVVGACNIQIACTDSVVYILEINPRASRTLPFISKARGVAFAQIATCVSLGQPLQQAIQTIIGIPLLPSYMNSPLASVKMPVFPWNKFNITDQRLGPEMRSTGEVMGIGTSNNEAYAKALLATGVHFFTAQERTNVVCILDQTTLYTYHQNSLRMIEKLVKLQYNIFVSKEMYVWCTEHCVELLKQIHQAPIPHLYSIACLIDTRDIRVLSHTEQQIRLRCIQEKIPVLLNIRNTNAYLDALQILIASTNDTTERTNHFTHLTIHPIQDIHKKITMYTI